MAEHRAVFDRAAADTRPGAAPSHGDPTAAIAAKAALKSGELHAASSGDEPLLLDLYCAETLAYGPAGLSLHKVWAPFDPAHGRCRNRGYYVVAALEGGIRYRRFGLTELPAARRCFDAVAAGGLEASEL